MKNINRLIDHTLLKPDAKQEEIEKLCAEAIKYHFMSVCVNPCNVNLCAKLLKGSDVKVCTVIGFPLGANISKTKIEETKYCLENGASEIDMVINIGRLKDKDYDYVENEIREIKNVCKDNILKVILETCLLSDEEIVKACQLSQNAGADFVKTSTGFSKGGATTHAVKLMRETVKDALGVKASGGIHSYEEAMAMVEAGANRIGASSGIKIVEGAKQ